MRVWGFGLEKCEENLIIYLTFFLSFSLGFFFSCAKVKKTSRQEKWIKFLLDCGKLFIPWNWLFFFPFLCPFHTISLSLSHSLSLTLSFSPFSHAFNSNNSTVYVVDDAEFRIENIIQHAINIIYALIILPQDTKTF